MISESKKLYHQRVIKSKPQNNNYFFQKQQYRFNLESFYCSNGVDFTEQFIAQHGTYITYLLYYYYIVLSYLLLCLATNIKFMFVFVQEY